MRAILVLLAVFSISANAYQFSEAQVFSIGQDVRNGKLQDLADKTDLTVTRIINRAVKELRKNKKDKLANQIEQRLHGEFEHYLGDKFRYNNLRDIGDHNPLSQWLADVYNKIEKELGVQTCKSLHLSDLKTLNYCIPICFRPCSFPMDQIQIGRIHEYRKHMCKGDVYYGLLSVITYWMVEIDCILSTSGIGAMLCGVASTGAEWFMASIVCPPISNHLYEAICHQ